MMLTEHRLTIEAKCPVDGATDTYNVYVRTTSQIDVELINEAAKELAAGPIYQEDFTRELGHALSAEVETHGIHSGVYTTCRYTP